MLCADNAMAQRPEDAEIIAAMGVMMEHVRDGGACA